MSREDQQTIRTCLNGHPDHFQVLVRRYERPLFTFLDGRLHDRTAAEEASQETFVRAYYGLKALKKREAFFSWLLGIADRVVRELHRAGVREAPSGIPVEELPAAADPPDDDADPALRRAVAELSSPFRDVVLLRFYEGLACAEISKRLEVPLNTVTKRLSRAYGLLRERLGTHEASIHRNEVAS